MAVKEDLLSIFSAGDGELFSGEELANRLGVSRNAVWKAIHALRAEGVPVASEPRRGYRLEPGGDFFTAWGIRRFLDPSLPLRLEVRSQVDSTNKIVKDLGAAGAPEGTVVAAGSQTAGRGRLGRSFHSPQGTGIYMTLLVRPTIPARDALWLTTAAAVAVAGAVEAVSGKPAGIKWVNDVYVDGLKVCGILTEGAMDLERGLLDYAAVGIGINVRPPEGGFPPEIKDIAGAVFAPGEGGPHVRCRLAAEVLQRFWRFYEALPDHPFHAEYCRRCLVTGKDIWVLRSGERFPAHALGVDEECRLLVEYPDGTKEALGTGEVSVRSRT